MIDPGLQGRVVLVTGANHGIGAATARAFAAQGARVLLHYYRLPGGVPGLDEAAALPGEALFRARQARDAGDVVRSIRAAGGAAEMWEADLADPAAIPALFDRAEALFGGVEVLVNNAAHCAPDTFLPAQILAPDARAVDAFPMRPVTPASIDAHFAVNSRAPALLTAEFARRHVARGAGWGRVVTVSTDGASGFSSEVSYGASKHASESFARAAASELGRFGITVNVVSLGPIQTGWIHPDLEEICRQNTPLGRVGQPEDVADVILFLASHQARWITGQLIYVGGGHQMGL